MQTENPYSAPDSALNGSELLNEVSSRYPFRPADALAKGVYIAVGVHILGLLATTAVTIYERNILGQVQSGAAALEAVRLSLLAGDRWLVLANALQMLALLVCYVIGGMWIYRAACNVRSLGARGLDDSPGWAVGWYAVPFANLAMPFRAMKQIRLASESPHGWRSRNTPVLLTTWWTLFLINGLGGYAVARLGAEKTVAALAIMQTWLIVYHVFSILAAVSFIKVVSEVTGLQASTHANPPSAPAALSDNPLFANP
ncbi:MAG TPA: DUF4328 domain-containing protein [Dyella sp.]|uniref:DUF4328 domain-containing protein n=1 Tax=Dyella sp. TaxID=1869338 RepID=UPI002F93CBBA